MNTNVSNSKSKSTINSIIEKTVETTNGLGITNKHPSKSKIQQVIDKLNKPLRKIAHASVYFILSILLMHSLRINNNITKKIILSILICFLYACSDEFHQTFVLGRTGQFIDVIIDTIGAMIGSSIIGLIYIKETRRHRYK
jgi:VanZ family protein